MIPFKPHELDVFFTSGRDLLSCVFNRTSGSSLRSAFNYEIPTHTGFMTQDHGQWFATELTEDGIEEDSFGKYLTTARFKSRLHSVYRWNGFANPAVVTDVLRHLAELRQADEGYDWVGAILCNKGSRALFKNAKSKKQKQFCSENVFETLRWKGWRGWPTRWTVHPPHPYDLHRQIALDGNFYLVYENSACAG